MERAIRCGGPPGVVVALLGRELKGGSFEVEDYTFAGLSEQTKLPDVMDAEPEEEDEK